MPLKSELTDLEALSEQAQRIDAALRKVEGALDQNTAFDGLSARLAAPLAELRATIKAVDDASGA